jgi:cytochrome c oxidase subunit 3
MASQNSYYVPAHSPWPIVGSVALFFMAFGAARAVDGASFGFESLGLGAVILTVMFFGWFGNVIHESMSGMYSPQLDRSFRLGMMWFIFSEVMFFMAFFGALFYIRVFSLPWIAGEGAKGITGEILYPGFQYIWPLLQNPSSEFVGAKGVIPTWGIPALNTCLLLSSGVTLTWSHWALKKNKHAQMVLSLGLTVILGLIFLGFQMYEYYHAHHEFALTLGSGSYGSTFYMLTGFHGMHVTLGVTMLIIIFYRTVKRHFTPEHHFAFEAVAWYWHFVDFVWLALFVFVYWL